MVDFGPVYQPSKEAKRGFCFMLARFQESRKVSLTALRL